MSGWGDGEEASRGSVGRSDEKGEVGEWVSGWSRALDKIRAFEKQMEWECRARGKVVRW